MVESVRRTAPNTKLGVEILNEGSGVSIDDAVTEMQATFVARAVEPMTAIASPFLPDVSNSGA
jgi:hypothetical protein